MSNQQYVLMTSGEYSSYGVSSLLVGPDSPPIAELVKTFHAEYLPPRQVTRRPRVATYVETVRDIEAARKRLLAEGVPVVDKTNYYGHDDSGYSSGEGLLEAWLIAQHGYHQVGYFECHEGSIDT